MPDYDALRAKLSELAERDWDLSAIEAGYRPIKAGGISRKPLIPSEILANRSEILDRVQRKAEEYNFLARNCARSTALAVMEEFGLGNMEVVKALSPFPGFGGTGWMCGGVTGGLIGLGLYFGSDDVQDHEAVGATFAAARKFMARFQEKVGEVVCPKIHEQVVFGRYMDPGSGPENMEAFAQAKGFQKCGLLAGIGARLAAEIIIDDIAGCAIPGPTPGSTC